MAEKRAVSRREFLKLAGVAGATVGVAGGLGGLVAACGTTTTSSTTASSTATTGATTSTAVASTETTAGVDDHRSRLRSKPAGPSSSAMWRPRPATSRRSPSPTTGSSIVPSRCSKTASSAATVRNTPSSSIEADSQSSTNRASQVAGDLVTNSKVDMLLASGTPDTANPVSDQGEALECPTLLSFAPWQALFFDPTGKPVEKKWIYGNMLGSEETIASFIDAFDKSGVTTNKKVGMLFQNDADFKGWMDPNAAPKVFKEAATSYGARIPTRPATRTSPSSSASSRPPVARSSAAPTTRRGCPRSCPRACSRASSPSSSARARPSSSRRPSESYPNKGIGLIGEVAWHPSWEIKDTLDPDCGFREPGRRLRSQDRPAVDCRYRLLRQGGMGHRRLQTGHEP